MTQSMQAIVKEKASLRVAFVSHVGSLGGGAESSLCDVVTALARQSSWEPLVVVPSLGELEGTLSDAGVPTAYAGYSWWCSHREVLARRGPAGISKDAALATWNQCRGGRSIAHALRDFRPQIIVSNTCVSAAGALAAATMRVPHLWFAREYGRADFGFSFFLGYWSSMRLLGSMSAAVIAVSNALGKSLERYVVARKITVMHNACMTPLGTPVAARSRNEPLKLVLVGRGVRAKGLADAIRAVAIVRRRGIDARLRIVGPVADADKEPCRALSLASGVADAVTFTGWVDDLLAELDDAHVGLMCSQSEAFGRVTVEYLRRGRPVIGSRSGGTPELIEEDVTGVLYDPGDCEALANHIESFARSNGLLTSLSCAALERNAHRFVLDHYVHDLCGVLDEVQSSRPYEVRRRRINAK